MHRIIKIILIIITMLSLSSCLSMIGTVTENSIHEEGKKVNNIVFIGTQYNLACITNEWGWNSPGHPGPGCVIDFPFSFALDAVLLPYTVPKSIWNITTDNAATKEKNKKPDSPN